MYVYLVTYIAHFRNLSKATVVMFETGSPTFVHAVEDDSFLLFPIFTIVFHSGVRWPTKFRALDEGEQTTELTATLG